MLMDKESSVNMLTWREIRASHKWFHEYDPKSFQRYIRDLRRANPEKVALIAEEKNLKDSPIKTNRGEPFWDSHPAKLLSREDVKVVDGQYLNLGTLKH
jgi:hypothetical protein